MKKVKDEDILKKYIELEEKQSKKFTSLRVFRKQFDDYLRAKSGRNVTDKSVPRPYIEIFRQPEKGKS